MKKTNFYLSEWKFAFECNHSYFEEATNHEDFLLLNTNNAKEIQSVKYQTSFPPPVDRMIKKACTVHTHVTQTEGIWRKCWNQYFSTSFLKVSFWFLFSSMHRSYFKA